MDKHKGGRGRKGDYDTKLMRVPTALENQIQELIQRYRFWVANGNTIIGTDNPPRLLDSDTDKPVNNFLLELEQVQSQLEQSTADANSWQLISEQAQDQIDKITQQNRQLKAELESLQSQIEQPDKPVNEFTSKPMKLRQLATFLGQKSHTYISKIKSEPTFEEWSRERDPHGNGWRYDPGSKLFYPLL